MRQIFFCLLTIAAFFFSCTTSPRKMEELENSYLAFEQRSIESMENASDEELQDLYLKYYSELSKIYINWLNKYKITDGRISSTYYRRWIIAIEDPFLRNTLYRAKNSGNYRVAGDSMWLSFQEKYIILNTLNRIIKACNIIGYDVSEEVLEKIANELQLDLKPLEGRTNTEQKEWIDKMMYNIFTLGIATSVGASNTYVYIVQYRSQLPEAVDLRNGIDEWRAWRKKLIEQEIDY